jgi:hypothetical protein
VKKMLLDILKKITIQRGTRMDASADQTAFLTWNDFISNIARGPRHTAYY